MARTIMSVLGGQKEAASDAKAARLESDGTLLEPTVPAAPDRSVMTLGRLLTFKGELSADEDMVFLGRMEGSISHTETLTIGVGAVVVGNLRARLLVIKGTVDGDLEASESIVIAPTATVTGDLASPRISIVEGAMFNGSVRMTRVESAEVPKGEVDKSSAPSGALSGGAVDQVLSGPVMR
jgi:cytoskeletal protein CcmA (bactofilin family)